MFKCGLCGKPSKAGERAARVVTQSRWVKYPFIKGAHRFVNREGHEMITDDPGGEGAQIVEEVLAHQTCAEAKALAEVSDENIDTSDIPEVRDWSKGVRGKYYRKTAQS